jgi:hypothetical protein
VRPWNESKILYETDGVGKIVPIEYFTYFIPFEYIFKQYPTEIIALSLTAPQSTVSTVSLNVNTSKGTYF